MVLSVLLVGRILFMLLVRDVFFGSTLLQKKIWEVEGEDFILLHRLDGRFWSCGGYLGNHQ